MSIPSYFLRIGHRELGDRCAFLKLGDMMFSTGKHGTVQYLDYLFELLCDDHEGIATVLVRDTLRDNKIVNKVTTKSTDWQEHIIWDKI